jgi:hypothetical protein
MVIRVNWVGIFIFTFLAFLVYCWTWIYVLECENKQIEKQLIEMRQDQQARELASKINFEIEKSWK